MAVFKIFPIKDATLYSEFPNMNTGLDAILECSTTRGEVSRTVIQFSQKEIDDILFKFKIQKNPTFYLRMFASNISGIFNKRTFHINPLYESWDMGTGKYGDSPINTNGVCWSYRDSLNVDNWETSYPVNVTGSYQPSNPGGGSWYYQHPSNLTPFPFYTLQYGNSDDVNIEITNIVNSWMDGSINENGIIIRQNSDYEFIDNRNNVSNAKYFSIDTNTIYPPHLEIKWEDYNSDPLTGSLEMDNMDFHISARNNSGEYFNSDTHKFKINSTPTSPTRVYQTSSLYNINYNLPLSSSFYAIKDVDTNLMVVDFDEIYTKISTDKNGSYFNIYMEGLEPERYYTILIKIIIGNEVKTFDEGIKFKILNG